MIIPRVRQSEKYIKGELDEMEREDNFRLKRFKELKLRRAGGKIVCALCKTELEQVEICELCQSCQEPRKKKILVCPLCEKHAEEEELNKEICRKNVCKNVASKVSSSQSRGDRIKFDDVCSCSDAVGDVLKLLCPNCQKQSEAQKQAPAQEKCSCEKVQKVSSVKKMDSRTSVCSCEKGKAEQKEMNMDDLCKIIGKQKISKLKEIYLQKQQSEDEIINKLKEVFDNDNCKCSSDSKKGNAAKANKQDSNDLCPICKKDLTENKSSEQQCPCTQSFPCAPKDSSNEALCSKCKKDKTGAKKTSISDPGLGAGKNRHTCNLCLHADFRPSYRNIVNSKSDTLCAKCKNDRGNPKNMTIQFTSCLSKGNAFNNTPNVNNQKKDDLLRICTHIDEIINLTSQYKTSSSVEEFIEACKDAKCKINKIPENNASPENDATTVSKKCSCKSSQPKQEEEKTAKPSEGNDQELGVFVTKFQEVVTVKRYLNSDGTIRETRQVITIRTETKNASDSALEDKPKNNKQSCLSSSGSSLKQRNSTSSSQSGKALKIAVPNQNFRERSSQTSSISNDVSIHSYTSCTISSDGEESKISIEHIDKSSAGAQTDNRDDICDNCKRLSEMKRRSAERSFSETDTQARSPNECCAPQRKTEGTKSCCAIKVVPKNQNNLYNNKEKGSNCLELLKKILLEADQSTASCLAKEADDVSYDSKFSNNTMGSKKKCNCKPEPSNATSQISCASCPSLSAGSKQKCCHTTKSPNQIKFCKRESECPECSKKEEEKPQPKCICKSFEETNKSSIKNACSCVSLDQKNSKAKASTCPSCASKSGPKNTKSGSSCASAVTTKSSCPCMQEKEDTKACCMKSKQKCCPKESVPSCPKCGPKQKPPEPPCPCGKKDKPIPKQSCTSCSSKATKSSSACPCNEDSKESDNNDTCCANSKKCQDQCNEPPNCPNCDYKPQRKSSGSCGPKSKRNTIVYMSYFMRDIMPTRNGNNYYTYACCTQTDNENIPGRKTSPCKASCSQEQPMENPCQCKQQMEAVKSSPNNNQQETIDTPCPICKEKQNSSKNVKKCSICGTAMDTESSSCNCNNKANNSSDECCSSALTPKPCCKKLRIECPEKETVSCPSCVASQKPPCTCKSKKIIIEHKSCSSCGSLITTKSETCICTEKDKSILKNGNQINGDNKANDKSSQESSPSCSICSQSSTEETSSGHRTNGNGTTRSCVQCGAAIIPETCCPCVKKPVLPTEKEICCQEQDKTDKIEKNSVKSTNSQKSLKEKGVKSTNSQKSLKEKVDCECNPKKGKTSKKSSKDALYVYTPIIPCREDSETKLAPVKSRCPLCNSELQPEETFVKTCCKTKANSKSNTSPKRQSSPTFRVEVSEFKCCPREKSPTCPSCRSLQHKESSCSCSSPSKTVSVKNLSSTSYASAMSPTSSTCSCRETGQQTQKSCFELDVNDQLCFAATSSYYKNPTNQCCSTETSSSCLKCSSNAQDTKSSCTCKSNKPEQNKSKPCASCGNPITPKPSKKCCDESDKQDCCTPSKSECTPKEKSCPCAAKAEKKPQKPQPARKAASESQSCCDKPKTKCCSKDPPPQEDPCSCKSGAKKAEPMKTCASCGGPITPKPSCKCSDKKTPAKSSSLNKPPSRTSNKSTQSTQSCPVCTTPKEQKCDCKKEAKPAKEEKKCTCKKEPKAEEKKCTCKKEPKPEPKCTCKKEPEPKEKKCTCKKEPEPAENKCNCKKGASQSSTPARSVSLNMTPQRGPSNTSKATQGSCPVCGTSKKETKKPETKCSCKKEPPAPEKKCTCKKEPKPAEKKCTCKKEPEPPAKKCTCKKEPEPPPKKCTCKKEPSPPQKKCTCKEPEPPPADECPCKASAKSSKYTVVTKSTSVPVKLSSSTSLRSKPSQKKCSCKEPEPPPSDDCPCKAGAKSNKYKVVTKSSSVPVKMSSSTSLRSKPSQKKCTCKEPEPPPTDGCPCKAEAKPSKYTVITKSTSVPVKLSSSSSMQRSRMSDKSDASDKVCPTCGSSREKTSGSSSVKDFKKVSDRKSSSIRIQVSESSCPTCPKNKDVSTSTRRTERYDVRNLEMMKPPDPPKKKKACTCFSDSYVGVDNWGNAAATRASSYHGRCYH